jgi:hypothetical protein
MKHASPLEAGVFRCCTVFDDVRYGEGQGSRTPFSALESRLRSRQMHCPPVAHRRAQTLIQDETRRRAMTLETEVNQAKKSRFVNISGLCRIVNAGDSLSPTSF